MSSDRQQSRTQHERTHEILDDLGVPGDHRIRDLVLEVGDGTTHRAAEESFSAGLAYLVTQCDREWEEKVSQRDVEDVANCTRTTIRKHYQEIARGLDLD